MHSPAIATKVIAVSLALSAFAVAIVAGLAAGNPARTILFSAVVSLIVCQFLGLFLGAAAERAIGDHLASYKSAHTMPGSPGAAPQKIPAPGVKSPLAL